MDADKRLIRRLNHWLRQILYPQVLDAACGLQDERSHAMFYKEGLRICSPGCSGTFSGGLRGVACRKRLNSTLPLVISRICPTTYASRSPSRENAREEIGSSVWSTWEVLPFPAMIRMTREPLDSPPRSTT